MGEPGSRDIEHVIFLGEPNPSLSVPIAIVLTSAAWRLFVGYLGRHTAFDLG